MRQELERIVQEVCACCGGAKAYLLPYPYSGGHLRIFTKDEPDFGEDYAAVRRGDNLFVTIRDARLLRALWEMEESTPQVGTEPQRGVFETLLHQVIRRQWTAQEMDEPLLARMALELDDDAARCRQVLKQMQPLLHRVYAQALRENREHSVLTAIARQAVYHMEHNN